ncbi:MAG: type II toxin-antitoxin system RelE/ParE family toxin [Planctomycetes bacterium]|nr:type II toxin-antitoxin system RelE/ParE family toxin [Planctomycetota bacterium]
MAEVVWTPQALDDLDAVCLFIARDSPRVAQTFAGRAFQAADRLALFPRSGRVVPELGIEDVREVFLQAYRIIYRVRGERAEILTVHHGARILDIDP